MKKKIKMKCTALAMCSLLSATPFRAIMITVYDYINQQRVDVALDRWNPPATKFNQYKLTEQEYQNDFRSISKTKVKRTKSNFYNDYPYNKTMASIITDIFVADPNTYNMFYTSTALETGQCPMSFSQRISYSETESFSYTEGFKLEPEIGNFLSLFSLNYEYTYEHSKKLEVSVEMTYSTNDKYSDYLYAELVRIDVYLPVIIEMYLPYRPASYIYYQDYKLFHYDSYYLFRYSKEQFGDYKFPETVNGELAFLSEKELYEDKYNMTKLSSNKVAKLNSNNF